MIIRKSNLTPINFGSLKILDYTQGMDTLSSVAEITAPPSSAHPEAWSIKSDKYYVVLSGEVKFTLDQVEFQLSAGDCCVVRKGSHFHYHNITKKEAKLLLVHTPPFNLNDEVLIT